MGDFAFSAAIGQFISRGLTEAQSQKIENRMHLPKQFEIYFIWAASPGGSGSFIGEWIDQMVDDKEEDPVGKVAKMKW